MKVTTDASLFGAWVAEQLANSPSAHRITDRSRLLDDQRQSQENVSKKFAPEVLDIGAGTGLLSLMIAQRCDAATIDAIELDAEASQQALENFSASPWHGRLCIHHGDIRAFQPGKKYDVIISNPPFYEKELRSEDPRRKLAMHEGLALEELSVVIRKNLKRDGLFFVLLPYKRSAEIRNLFSSYQLGIDHVILVRQSVNHDYFRMMISGNLGAGKEITEEIAIMDANGEYTPVFAKLLKEYYLNM